MKYKGKMKRILPILLAAALWVEGTCGTVYAAETAGQAVKEQAADEVALSQTQDTDDGGVLAAESGEGQTPSTDDEGGQSAPGETPDGKETSAEGEDTSVSGEPQTPGGEETPAPEEPKQPDGEETTDPDEAEKPGEEDKDEGEPDEQPKEDDALPEEPENPQETPDPDAPEETPVDTVSENDLETETPNAEIETETAFTGEDALGEPPLMQGEGARFYSSAEGAALGASSGHKTPSAAEIIERYKAYPWRLDVSNTYSQKPSTKSPYVAGHLSDDSLENALKLLNFIRYVAGISADVTLNEDYTALAQAGALVNCVNGELSHTPVQPEGFPDELYNTGKTGCSKSNIAVGYGSIAQTLLNGWMYDGDDKNVMTMGHRRWVLNPAMSQTGFGAVDRFSAMYAFDANGGGITDYVAWPAQNMPIELMNGTGTPWTVSLGSDYKKAEVSKVRVTLQNLVNNKTYTFPSTSGSSGLIQIETSYYGVPNCIIFRPNGVSYNKDSRFRVTITGLTDKNGQDTSLSYDVNFFSLQEEPSQVEKVTLDQKQLHLRLQGTEDEKKAQLSAVITPDNAADQTLVWKSSDEKVASVSENDLTGLHALVEAKGVGETEISATAANGVQAVCSVKVSAYSLAGEGLVCDGQTGAYSLHFDLATDAAPKKLLVMDGDKVAADRMTWQSENEEIAVVDTDGTVRPVAVGETGVWVNIADMETLSVKVTVEDSSLPALQMREESCVLRAGQADREGEKKQLKLYFTPADTKWKNSVKWHSSNTAAVTFIKDGAETGETIGGAAVWIQAKGAGEAKISATIVDEAGKPVMQDGHQAQAVCTVTVQTEAALSEKDIPVPVALTNTQTTLSAVALPEGWRWQYPDTPLAQFAGMRSKKFAAVYEREGYLPAQRFLEVRFITVKSLSMDLRPVQGQGTCDLSRLVKGQTLECYVNYFSDETRALFEGADAPYKDNADYLKHKQTVEQGLQWSSTNAAVTAVSFVGDDVKITAQGAGTTTLKAQLKLGKQTFTASVKLTVLDTASGALTIQSIESFTLTPKQEEDGSDSYTALLSAFAGTKANQENSRIVLTLPEAAKVNAKSSNPKVIAVKAAKAQGSGFMVPLSIKAAGTAQITLTGNDAAKTTKIITLTVADPEPGLGEESLTVNTMQSTGTAFSLYPAKKPEGGVYAVSGLRMANDEKSGLFILTAASGNAEKEEEQSFWLKAKSGTKTGSYQVKICATAAGTVYELPLTVKVTAKKPVCKVKQKSKLNLFYKNASSLLEIDTGEDQIDTSGGKPGVTLKGCGDYEVIRQDGTYALRAKTGATLNSVNKGSLSITLEGYNEPVILPFTVGVKKKTPKLAWDTTKITLYPKAGINKIRIGLKNADAGFWDTVRAEKSGGTAKGNYQVTVEDQGLVITGRNLNQAESFQMPIVLKDSENWTDDLLFTLTVKVTMGKPSIVLADKTLQLNANQAYMGYDAASTQVRWKEGGDILTDQDVRVSVYYDKKDKRARELVTGSQVAFSVMGGQVAVRLNNRAVTPGSYKFTVQAAKGGNVWKTPLVVKIVDTPPEKAVKISAKGSIDVLDRENSFMTLTPVLKAVNGSFVIPEAADEETDRKVELRGRDAHLFRARWDESGTKIELRAKQGETLVTKYQYSVIPVIVLKNAGGETEQIETPVVKFKVKQSRARVNILPQKAQIYSGACNSVELRAGAVLKGVPAPEIESVTLLGNTDVFTVRDFVYDETTRQGTLRLAMKYPGAAVKGKSYSLQLQVRLEDQADNEKPVTVRYTVKVK